MQAARTSALFVLALGIIFACGARTPLDADGLGPLGVVAGLRLVAPLSTSTVTTQTPTLRWILGADRDGAQIDLCHDRACSGDVTTFTVKGTSAQPPTTLAPGVHFWRARSTSKGKVGADSSPVWEFWVGARSAPVDTSWGTTLDVNGDGLPDLAVGAPDASSNLGKAYVYLGTATGFSTTPSTTLVGNALPEAPDQGFFGTSVASAGDLNGDGFGDLVVCAFSDGTADPLAYVFFGGPSGITGSPIILRDHDEGGYPGSAAAAGDVNGDGFGDLIVGEMTQHDGNTSAFGYVYFGSADGPVTTTKLLGPVAPGAMFGPIVASAGDVDGDGFADVFVGGDYFLNRQGGNSFVYRGSASGPSPTPLVTLTGPAGANLNYASTPPCAVDLDGDGFSDLVLRGPGEGFAFIYPGGAALAPTPTTILEAVPTDDNDGWAVSMSAGDVDGDGFADLVIGSNGVNDNTGTAYLYLGSPTGVAQIPTATLEGPDGPQGFFGTSVIVSDFDGDGFADVAIGAFRFNDDVGRAYMFRGNSAGFATTPATTFIAPDGGRFGDSIG